MLDALLPGTLTAAIVLSGLLALFRGGAAERIGGGANLACGVAFVVLQRLLQGASLEFALLAVDGLLALTFLALAIRFAALWIGGAMLLQAVQFSLHAYYFVGRKPPDALFGTVNNIVSWGVVFCILAGTLVTWRRASLARRAA